MAQTKERATGAASVEERPPLDSELGLRLYRLMVECRYFEKRAQELFFEGLVRGTTHLGVGQEAVAAGFGAAMREDDYSFATYRGHNHALVRGVPMAPIFAELFGRATGLMGAKGGSMHITSVEHHMMGSYAIVGAHLPIALGAAWSAQYRKSGQVAVCFFGDGTTNIGAFHEALNMAVVWKAPVVFVCENNHYMEYTPIGAVTAVKQPAADRACAYGLERILIDGNDVEEVYATAQRTLERARAGEGPSLVEALTYRHGGHSRADPGKYRPEEELQAWLARDPVPAFRSRLQEAGVDESRIVEVEERTREMVAAAERDARAAPEPTEDVIATQLWADGGSAWRSGRADG
ncbi:MAG TPA: thiamine pyrophosphate-dependent dehydrogenase E1 component subunit alpha [Candidatus Limnocylindria bacterium]|nr:thiamine pyrophosphate-dependent dehydrogenase E1 component subunit alpha [Candidatus Limnocylindria bacterium]